MFEKNNKRSRLGQSAAELAIFGAIVIFVIGSILKVSIGSSMRSNINLRVHRMALHESYRTALGEYAGTFSGGRNSASILLIEDRLSIDPSKKHGTSDRVPLMAQANATMSINLFMALDHEDIYDRPVYDIIINGQRFPLSISDVKEKTIFSDLAPPNCTNNIYGEKRGQDVGFCFDGAAGEIVFFRKSYNGEDGVWCFDSTVNPMDPGGTPSCSGTTPKPDSWSTESRFDLDFDGTADFDVDADVIPGGRALKGVFGWQWVRMDPDDFIEGTSVDIDGDWKEEKIISCKNAGVLLKCKYLDYQEGDYDTTFDSGTERYYEMLLAKGAIPDPVTPPGLEQDVRAYGFTHDGTMLRNQEGRLYTATAGPEAQFVRNERVRDHIDIIERVLNLSNQTGRFCQDLTTPRDWSDETYAKPRGLMGITNPVEACGDCFDVVAGIDHRKLTCMDTAGPTIYVRSRLRDRRKKRWITLTHDGN